MKRLLLVISLIVPLLFSHVNVDIAEAEESMELNTNCDTGEYSSVRIINNYNAFVGNGFVYSSDNYYTYIVTSYNLINDINNFSVIYSNGVYSNATIIGYDSYNEIAVLKTVKIVGYRGICTSNSHYLYKGQKNYLYGYLNNEENFIKIGNLSSVGELYSNNNYRRVYKSIIQVKGMDVLRGVAVYDELDRFIGMITGYDSKLMESCYIVDVNKLIKVVDSIVKTGNYKINYIKYSLVDYSLLSTRLRESYGVNKKVNGGVVIVTFKPFNYVFGGLNQGMVIFAVNGVMVNSEYELDKQISRYDKNDKVCLSVIKKNGKVDYYYVKV